MIKRNIIIQITIIFIWAPSNCKSNMATNVDTKRKNGYEFYNPIFLFLISYTFTAVIMKIMFEILK